LWYAVGVVLFINNYIMRILWRELKYVDILNGETYVGFTNGVLLIIEDDDIFVTYNTKEGRIHLSQLEMFYVKGVIKRFNDSGVDVILDDNLYVW